ncbi:hypothetical protein L9F63_019462 [Diploptera punctata]|uniref:Uncharacterized protein n=1 Tax=Diploptera punctata TaxID=6984 RepID=A0AAD7ZUK2_DIPPU|nr:hypothetical protein L9F63_019462 [Diploptera punctata]
MKLKLFTILMKSLYLVCTVAATCLYCSAQNDSISVSKEIFQHVGLTAFFWIGGCIVISVSWDFNLSNKIDIVMSIVLCFITCGGSAITIQNFADGEKDISKLAVTSAIIGFFLTFLLATDVVTAFLESSEQEEHSRSLQSIPEPVPPETSAPVNPEG